MLRTNNIFARLQNDCLMVRKMDEAFDFKAVDHCLNNYKFSYGDFVFLNLAKRSTTHDNSSSGTTPHSSGDRA